MEEKFFTADSVNTENVHSFCLTGSLVCVSMFYSDLYYILKIGLNH